MQPFSFFKKHHLKLFSIVVLLCAIFVLQGCVVALLGAGAATTKVAVDPRTTGSQVDDVALYSKVNSQMSKTQELKTFFKGSSITASSYNGNILFVGEAANQAQINKAIELAEQVQGVEAVYNQIRIAPLLSAGTVTNDAWITSKVKSSLITNGMTKARDIKVITNDSIVYLMGIVTKEEGDEAAKVASEIDGVQEVVKVFTYI